MKFSLIFFSGDERNKYRLVLDVARFADEHRFHAIWTPERHFHRFGGLYPNPSVLSAGLAMSTRRLKIRAGSVIFPIHHPVRVAEEWAIVDNLSGGRVGMAIATGFSPLDFVLRPEAWSDRRRITFEGIATLRQLWEGAPVSLRDGVGNAVEVELHPRPIQQELPIWLTCTKSPETFVRAAQLGCHVLTGLVDMTLDEVGVRLQEYRRALVEHGHDPTQFEITLMLHTFIGQELAAVREQVRGPFLQYLRSFFKVINSQKKSLNADGSLDNMAEKDQDALLGFGFEKFFGGQSLLGTAESCARVVERVKAMGVTEIACLMDFGMPEDLVLQSMDALAKLKNQFA